MTSAVTPQQILSFWFGEGVWGSPEIASVNFSIQSPLWWGMKSDLSGPISPEEKTAIDESCQVFAEFVRKCGRGELSDPIWDTPDGLYAQVLLCDQLSRNCFRGTDEAFAYDSKGSEIARKLVANEHHLAFTSPDLFVFLLTPGQHSEDLQDHAMNLEILQVLADKFGADNRTYLFTKKHCEDHYDVVRRFGRYPHRNAALGRENTADESVWLADHDNLPAWAKSQVPKPKPL
mmetsp:Transcript_47372/g.76342  ORF Transcript_47372/g.76342 Transcript_47372/m.76342 type:complete len:233 (-) Transcript_47372:66-764(-)